MKTKSKLRLNQFLGGLTMVLPLGIGVGVNFGDYVENTPAAVGLTLGGALAVFIVILQILGKAKKVLGSGVIISGIVFGACVFLEPLILNLKFLSGLMFLGQAGYLVGFSGRIKNLQEQQSTEKTATATAVALDTVVKQISGRV